MQRDHTETFSESNPEIRAPRVLIVEDNLRYAHALSRAFRLPEKMLPFDVDVAADLSEALPHVERDDIDIYVIDLAVPEKANSVDLAENGKSLISLILRQSDAGILVHSDSPLWRTGEEIFALGADDYLDKGNSPEIVRAKAFALWRRVKMTRSGVNKHLVHTNRVFRIREWRFVIGERLLVNDRSETARLSPTEHAFLSYLCTVEDHQIDRREFNVGVLGRPAYEQDKRIDNLVYQINQKLGTCLQNTSKENGTYRLLYVNELRAAR